MSENEGSDWLARETGRIPECLERYPLGEETIRQLLNLHEDSFNFNPTAIAQHGWTAIDAEESGGILDDERDLIVEFAHSIGVNTLYATSKHELDQAENGRVLLARIPNFTVDDLFSLEMGGWGIGEWIEILKSRNLLWDSWREGIYFTLPLRFAVIRLVDGYGHTTIAGPVELTNMVKSRSHHGLYEWREWQGLKGLKGPKD